MFPCLREEKLTSAQVWEGRFSKTQKALTSIDFCLTTVLAIFQMLQETFAIKGIEAFGLEAHFADLDHPQLTPAPVIGL